MRVFVTGRDGQVARSLRELGAGDARFTLHFAARPEVDLLKPETVRTAIEAFRPDVVINPAAYTAVDKAESEPDLAFAINRDGAGAVAAAAAALGVYGRSKLEGEWAVAAANPRSLIIRTAWVYAPFGANFLRTMLRLAGERDRLRVVDDQIGCPTYAPDIAWALLSMASQLCGRAWRDELAGVTHLAGPDTVSWCGFARLILEAAGTRGARTVPVDAITTADFPTPARRPANSCLSTYRLEADFGLKMPSLRSSIDRCLDQLLVSETTAHGGRV
jgi:dTDP-4-dehydrorhamnose reductase